MTAVLDHILRAGDSLLVAPGTQRVFADAGWRGDSAEAAHPVANVAATIKTAARNMFSNLRLVT